MRYIKNILELIMSALILIFIGTLFVGFSFFLGKYELIFVALILVGASWVKPFIPRQLRETCECIPLVGEGLEIFNKLEAHYLKYSARSNFYYILYPLTSLWGFIGGRNSDRYELSSYFSLIRWLVILLVIESATIYYKLSQHFSLTFTLKWLYLELLCLYFLANLFMVPLSTLSLKFSIAEKRTRLWILGSIVFSTIVGLTVFFNQSGSFYQIIPKNVALEQHFQQLTPNPSRMGSYKVSAGSVRIDSLSKENSFFQRFEQEFIELLTLSLPQWEEFSNQRSYDQQSEVLAQINQRLQERLQRLSIFDEQELFYLTLSAQKDKIWGLVAIPFRESILYFFKYEPQDLRERSSSLIHFKEFENHGGLTIYNQWEQLNSQDAKYLTQLAWDSNHYKFNYVKRFAQLITQYITDQVQLKLQANLSQEDLGSDKEEKHSRQELKNLRLQARKTLEPHSFILYSRELKEFDYQRALTKGLIYDHQGSMPELIKPWWTDLYKWFLSFLFLMFKLSMPIHIAVIIYCKMRLKSDFGA